MRIATTCSLVAVFIMSISCGEPAGGSHERSSDAVAVGADAGSQGNGNSTSTLERCGLKSDGSGADRDGDGAPDRCDNCADTPNPLQADSNDDGVGDACTSRPVGEVCGKASGDVEPLEPDLYFLIDRSSSMHDRDGTSETRLERAKNGLDKIARRLAGKVRLGMSTYPCASEKSECGLELNHEFLPLGKYSAQQIIDSYRSNFSDSTCPHDDAAGLSGLDVEEGGIHMTETGEALANIRNNQLYRDSDDPLTGEREKRVVLITDGRACGCGDDDCGGRQPHTLEQLRKLRKAGVKTYVVGFQFSASLLNTAAQAGGTDAGSSGTPYFYEVTSATQLVNATQNLVRQTVSCTYKLNRTGDEIDAKKVWVKVAGEWLEDSEFTYDASNQTVSLSDSACKKARSANASVKAVAGCATCHPVGYACTKDSECCSGNCAGPASGQKVCTAM